AINHLREALGDSAESPRFIETLPKRGYRFIAPVEDGSDRNVLLEPPAGTEPPAPATGRGFARLPWVIAAVSVVIAAIAGAPLWRGTRPADRSMIRFSVDLGPEATPGLIGGESNVGLSPDGTRLVYTVKGTQGHTLLATRRLDQPVLNVLAGTED